MCVCTYKYKVSSYHRYEEYDESDVCNVTR